MVLTHTDVRNEMIGSPARMYSLKNDDTLNMRSTRLSAVSHRAPTPPLTTARCRAREQRSALGSPALDSEAIEVPKSRSLGANASLVSFGAGFGSKSAAMYAGKYASKVSEAKTTPSE